MAVVQGLGHVRWRIPTQHERRSPKSSSAAAPISPRPDGSLADDIEPATLITVRFLCSLIETAGASHLMVCSLDRDFIVNDRVVLVIGVAKLSLLGRSTVVLVVIVVVDGKLSRKVKTLGIGQGYHPSLHTVHVVVVIVAAIPGPGGSIRIR